MVTASAWRRRRIFLTGHTGFKGSWLSLWLQSLDVELSGLALAPDTQPSLFDVARVGSGMTSTIGDIRELHVVRTAMQAAKPDVVFHLAAQPLVRESYRTPVETFATNVMGTVNVLESVRQCPSVKAVVVITSDKSYENREWPWGYRESDAMGGSDPYSASKGCAELVTAAYRRSFFGGAQTSRHPALVATARAGNVIGGGDWAEDRIVPDIVRAARSGMPVKIRNPYAVRPWQHVLEPLHGYLVLAERLLGGDARFADAWNFGPFEADALPVGKLVEKMRASWPGMPVPERDDASHPHEAHYLRLDWAKARDDLGWVPRWRIDEAVARTAAWYRRHLEGVDARQLVLEQIEEYSGGN
jgi:CDP-glucose 4,6-dehydratase